MLLAVAVYVIWGWVESARLSRVIAAIRQRGEPVNLDYRQKPPETQEQQTAARLYAEAADLAQERARDENYRFSRLDVDRAGPPVLDLAELADAYRNDAPPLQLLDQATALDFTRFGPIAAESEIQFLQSLSSLNALRADLLSRRHDPEAAAAALVASIRIHRAMPTTFYRYQADSRLLGSLRIFLRHTAAADGTLSTLQRAFAEWPDEDSLARETIGRRAEFLQSLSGPRGSVGEAVLFAVFRPAISYYARRQLQAFDDVIAVAREPWRRKLDDVPALLRRYPDPSQWRNRGTLKNLIEQGPPWLAIASFYLDPAGLDLATRRVAITVLAVERYRRAHAGVVPPTLDALVPALFPAVPEDPFSGKPLVYKTAADSYIVYSIDTNRLDDGGVLYGHGAMATTGPRSARSPRDFGIRVPLTPQH